MTRARTRLADDLMSFDINIMMAGVCLHFQAAELVAHQRGGLESFSEVSAVYILDYQKEEYPIRVE